MYVWSKIEQVLARHYVLQLSQNCIHHWTCCNTTELWQTDAVLIINTFINIQCDGRQLVFYNDHYGAKSLTWLVAMHCPHVTHLNPCKPWPINSCHTSSEVLGLYDIQIWSAVKHGGKAKYCVTQVFSFVLRFRLLISHVTRCTPTCIIRVIRACHGCVTWPSTPCSGRSE